MGQLNIGNFGVFTGRVARDLAVFENKDGSRKYKFTLLQDYGKPGPDGKRPTNGVDFEAFAPAGAKSPWEYVGKGDKITVHYELRANNYTDANNERHFTQVAHVVTMNFDESKKTTDDRRAAQAAAAAAEVGEVPEA